MNPYEVLGIKEGASEAEIKAAYKKLVKQYHPDKYKNNPLADLAEEKMQEINEAYDMLMKNPGGSGSGYGQSSYGNSSFMQVRRDIDMGNLDTALNALNRSSNRNAEWYFLRGVAAYRKGWYDDAINNLETAVNMDPSNEEYRNHYNNVANRGGMFRNQAAGRGYQGGRGDDFCCQALQCYICADCCCDVI